MMRHLALGLMVLLLFAGCSRDEVDGERPDHPQRAGPQSAGEANHGDKRMAPDPTADHDDANCPPGSAGCRCEQGRKGCGPGLECFGDYCYGGKVPKPKTYFYEKKQFDDVRLIRELVMARLPVAPGMKVADIGAGHGWFSVRIAEAVHPGGRVYATDILKEPLAFLQGFSAGLHHVGRRHARIEPRLCRGDRDTALDDVAANSVDLVLMINSLIFLDDPKGKAADQAYVGKLVRLLRPGGLLVLHNDWVFPNALGRKGVVELLVAAGLAPQVQELAMPAHMPAQTFYEERPGGTRRTLRRGFVIGLNKPAGEALQFKASEPPPAAKAQQPAAQGAKVP